MLATILFRILAFPFVLVLGFWAPCACGATSCGTLYATAGKLLPTLNIAARRSKTYWYLSKVKLTMPGRKLNPNSMKKNPKPFRLWPDAEPFKKIIVTLWFIALVYLFSFFIRFPAVSIAILIALLFIGGTLFNHFILTPKICPPLPQV